VDRDRLVRFVAVVAALGLVTAACAQKKKEPVAEGKRGGSIVLGAEQWPECINTVTSCANASWLGWSVTNYVLPQLMEFDEKGNFIPSPLLTGQPQLDEGPPFKITYKLDPAAVWDDGTAITSADVEFTWQARLKTTGTLSKVGYEKIQGVDTSDPTTAVVTFTEPFADWPDLFGGNQQFVLKKAAFASSDVSKDMLEGITFSGGPWKLQSWNKQQAVLVRNDKYWAKDRIPLLDQVTMVPRTDQDTEITALKTGEVVAIFPQPAPGFADKVKDPATKFVVGASVVYEGLWFNHDREPVTDKAVREALFYGVDRQAIVDNVIAKIVPGVKVLNCGGWVNGATRPTSPTSPTTRRKRGSS
jgi:peptide/nickel transport system substrate-binding protein